MRWCARLRNKYIPTRGLSIFLLKQGRITDKFEEVKLFDEGERREAESGNGEGVAGSRDRIRRPINDTRGHRYQSYLVQPAP